MYWFCYRHVGWVGSGSSLWFWSLSLMANGVEHLSFHVLPFYYYFIIIIIYFYYYLFIHLFILVVLGSELSFAFVRQVLYWLRHISMFWLFWSQGLAFCPGWPELQFFYFRLPTIAGMTGTQHHTQLFSLEMGSHKLFCPGWLRTMILPISTSQVARIIVVSHQSLAHSFLNMLQLGICLHHCKKMTLYKATSKGQLSIFIFLYLSMI
jgi:hypothetical protein